MKAESFELPNEFSKYEVLIQEDFENFYSVYQKYQYQNNTFFQSVVYACDDLANSNKTLEKYRTAYTEISLLGYFLLSQYKQVLTFMTRNNSFEINYFRFKAAMITGERGIISAILANIMTALVELKKKDPETHKVFFTIMSLEIAAMNSDVDSVKKYAVKIREMLFNTVLIQDYPLVALQIVSDLAYREFRTGDESYEGWLEIYKELAEALSMDSKRLDCYTMLGGLYRFKGFLDEASEYYNKAFEIAEKVGNKEFKASLISNMADLEHTLGNLEKALLLCNNALKDPELSQSKPNLYINKAEILIKQEKYSEAITNLKMVEKLSNRSTPIVNILYGYALTKLPGKEYLHEGMKYLEKGGHLSEQSKNHRWIATYYYYMGRTYLDNYDLSSSINAFEKCYDYAIRSEFQYVVLSQLFLAESYLHRYKISQSDNDLTYSERYLANVITICQEQELPILADVLYLKGQLLIALGEFADAYSVFRQTKEIALQNDNSLLAISCEKNIEMLDSDSIDKSTLITTEITEVIKILSKQSYVKKTEKLPDIYFLNIFTDDGISFYSHLFRDQTPINDVLLSAILTAVKTMSNELFGTGLRGIDFEGKTLLVEGFGNFVGVLACERDSFNARTKLFNFMKRFNEKFAEHTLVQVSQETKKDIKKQADLLVEIIFEKSLKGIVTAI